MKIKTKARERKKKQNKIKPKGTVESKQSCCHTGLASSDDGITNPLCGSDLRVPQGKGVSFFCRPALFGQYVTIRVTRSPPTSLHICEVEVYSERRGASHVSVNH